MPTIESAYEMLTRLLSAKRSTALSIQKKTQFIASCLDAGDILVRVGSDLVRLKPNGEMETVEGFFDQSGWVEASQLPDEVTQAWRAALGRVISGNVEVAQAATPVETTTDVNPVDLSNPSPESTVIAKVTSISGSAQVIRQGVLMTLSVGDSVYLGDIISSQSNSKVNLNMTKSDLGSTSGTGVSIGESTR
ncbi:MAG: hypothetical protein ACOVKR_02475, partial [Limnohabitans sp.]